MSNFKNLGRIALLLILAVAIGGHPVKPALADDSAPTQPKLESGAGAPGAGGAISGASEISTRPVNEKILPLIKEGYSQLSKGSYDKAIKSLKSAISIDKDAISARRYLAYGLIMKGQAKEALAQMQTVSKLVPPNAFDFYLFAAAYYAAGGVQEARDCYNEALRQNPNYDAARAGLIKTLAHQANFEEALNNVQIGLQLTKDESVKKYYTSLSKAVAEAQTYHFQTVQGSGSTAPVSGQAGSNSVKSQPILIK